MKGGKNMKKLINKLLAVSADLALETLVAAAGLASVGGIYQPKAPKNLQKVVTKHKAR